MFADSLLETSWDQRSRRSWITFTSFGLQSVVIGLLLLIPLLTTVGLRASRILQPPTSFGAPPPPRPRPIERQRPAQIAQSNLAHNVPIAPQSIPPKVAIINEVEAPPQVSYSTGPGVEGSTGDGEEEGVRKGSGSGTPAVAPLPPPVPNVHTFRTSSILEGSLIRRVQPAYPPLARSVRVQGAVVLAALIGKEGMIENLRLVSGHPMLVPAAIAAVSQWRYKPYILNGEAIEVETQITVNFILSGN
jgi:periplasmic protein TonB